MRIDFIDANDLRRNVLSYQVAPQKPGAMCTLSATALLYVDESKDVSEVRWLDCRKATPKPGKILLYSSAGFPPIREIRESYENFFQLGKSKEKQGVFSQNEGNFPTVGQ